MKKSIEKIIKILFLLLFSIFVNGCKDNSSSGGNHVRSALSCRLIHNDDGNGPLGCSSVEEINAYVDDYTHTQITTFMICSGSDFFHYRSKYGNVFGDEHNYLKLEEEGTDMISATLQRARKKGMEAFITYRMNDIHFNDTTLSNVPANAISSFWKQHPEYWLKENVGWHAEGAYDFSHEQVRQRKLEIITEQLEKYGELIDGYDLDFMRFIVYFKSSEDRSNKEKMTELVKAVRAEVNKQSDKHGRKILLSARVPTSFDDCLKKGLDIKEWINQGLLDFVSIGVHYAGNPAMPIRKFITDIGNPDIPVYASIESGGYAPREPYSHGMFRGMASHIFAKGGDGIYLFNFFFNSYKKNNRQIYLEEGGQVCRVITPDLLHEIGSLNTLQQRNKIYCLDDGIIQYGLKPDTPLPMIVSVTNKSTAKVFIGDNVEEDKPEEIILFIRTNRPSQIRLWVNEVEIEKQMPGYVNLYDKDNNLNDNERVYAFVLPISCLRQGDNEISFQSTDELFSIKRLELALKYGDVNSNGYF